ncbi:MAG: type IV toxin-antitoxin system AbiEi family antitoxin domain-containing protein [Deltaproteobacteria bacterium]|nr:type IV toxin-antitoxin system AbiEi family antitoxin domain-containing protein [Deltaproteobacteria bacterium]
MTQSVENKVKSRVYGHKRGWVFSPADLADLGSDIAIHTALSRLTEKKIIRRLTRGIYDYPRIHKALGKLAAPPEDIARALARKDKAKIQPTGAYAANILGFSNQVPAKIVYLTDRKARIVKVGKITIELRNTTLRNMATAGRFSGLLIQALRYIGKGNIGKKELSGFRKRISDEQIKQLRADVRYASPAWIADIFRYLIKKKENDV